MSAVALTKRTPDNIPWFAEAACFNARKWRWMYWMAFLVGIATFGR
jgi:hypothetical protein